MKTALYSRETLQSKIGRYGDASAENNLNVRLLFAPRKLNEQTVDEFCSVYSKISGESFETVVIVESHFGETKRKLPMPSFKSVETPFGEVMVNDKLRNEFADEDDDFFIDDDAFDENVSIHDQLMLLQSVLDDFSILSIQITDSNSFIVKELAYALEEVLLSRNMLIVFCCDLKSEHTDELRSVLEYIENDNFSALLNYLNSGRSSVEGVGTFITGLIVAQKWGLTLDFEVLNGKNVSNALTGYAHLQPQISNRK
ncbi:MAG: AmmeMemoRadiSam system protein B [Balneolaceae bacterium]|nr:MAG: AmmeMemoRadiSam system protein B [Balneolaceae bacterium]